MAALNYKQEKILDGMVTMEMFGFRNLKRDSDARALAERILQETGREETDSVFAPFYAQRLMYTENIYFNWHEEAPPEFRSLETFWQMHSSGEPASECYLWYIENVSNVITNQWSDAQDRAHKIWKPPVEKDPNKTTAELEAEGLKADPN